MYQSVIRDPGGDSIVRIVSDISSNRSAVVDGSILIVPADTVAFIVINGEISDPYGPGRYSIFTGVSPFFVRLRHIMTNGDSATSVSVFYVSTKKHLFKTLPTGEILFRERRFEITMKALGVCRFSITVSRPEDFVSKIVGMSSLDFSDEDIDECIAQIVLPPVRKELSNTLSNYRVTEFNSHLSEIAAACFDSIRDDMGNFGIKLESFTLSAVNVPDSEMKRLYAPEDIVSQGMAVTDAEIHNLERLYDGDIMKRMLSETLTGFPSRGQPINSSNNASRGGADFMTLALLMQMSPFREAIGNVMGQHTDLFRAAPSNPQENASNPNSPPPIPPRRPVRCPACNSELSRGTAVCPVCGHRL